MRKTLSTVLIFTILLFFGGAYPRTSYADATITTTAGTVEFIGYGYSDSQVASAQSFLTTQAGTISSVLINTKKNGSPTGTLTVGIQTNVSGAPSNTFLNSGTKNIADLTTSCADYTITFAAPVTVTDATTYWIVKSPNNTRDQVNYLGGCGAAVGNPYASGNEAYSNTTPTWTNETNSDWRISLTINDVATAAVKVPDIIIFD